MGTQNKINKKELKVSRISYQKDSEMMTPLASKVTVIHDVCMCFGNVRDMSPNP